MVWPSYTNTLECAIDYVRLLDRGIVWPSYANTPK
jgi:hypothetical protein